MNDKLIIMMVSFFFLVTTFANQNKLEYDQFLFKDEKVIFFKNQPFQIQSWSLDDFKNGKESFQKEWIDVKSPFPDFYPLFWSLGQSDHYLVLEFSQRSIWLLDSNFQRQSLLRLPETILNMDWTEVKFFWVEPYFIFFIFPKLKKVYRYLQISQRLVSIRVFDLPYIYENIFLFFNEKDQPYFSFSSRYRNDYYNMSLLKQKNKDQFKKYARPFSSLWMIQKEKTLPLSLEVQAQFYCFENNVLFICP